MSVPYLPVNNTNCIVSLAWQTIAHDELELWMIGVILSAMVYGGVISLTLSYFPLLLRTSYDISRRMRIFLLVYVTFMVAISTVYIITIIIALRNSVPVDGSNNNDLCGAMFGISPDWFQNGYAGGYCITFANWGADGFMLWRCAMIYDGISRPRRIALLSVLGFMALMSLASGLGFLISNFVFFLAITAVTIFLNLITATLITFRILYFDRYIRKTVGLERNSPYMTIIIICVESSALIVVFGLIYLILYFKATNASLIPLHLLVHVYVISPLLIVYRVARGRAATVRQRPSENGPVVSAMCFEPPPPPPLSSSKNEA